MSGLHRDATTTPGTSIDIDEESQRWFVERTPLGRPGQPEDIADTVIMFCSERSRFVVSLLVDGGFSGHEPMNYAQYMVATAPSHPARRSGWIFAGRHENTDLLALSR